MENNFLARNFHGVFLRLCIINFVKLKKSFSLFIVTFAGIVEQWIDFMKCSKTLKFNELTRNFYVWVTLQEWSYEKSSSYLLPDWTLIVTQENQAIFKLNKILDSADITKNYLSRQEYDKSFIFNIAFSELLKPTSNNTLILCRTAIKFISYFYCSNFTKKAVYI